MFCPICHAEFIPGFTSCDECGVELVDELPAEPPRGRAAARSLPWSAGGDSPEGSRGPSSSRPVELVTVFRSGDPGLVALVKSILMDAGIPFVDTWPVFGPGGAIRVAREDAADAEALLAELEAPSDDSASDTEEWEDDDEQLAGPGAAASAGQVASAPAGHLRQAPAGTRPDAAAARVPPASSAAQEREEQSPAGETSRSPDVTAPTAPTAPTPPPGVEPPSRRR